MSGAVGTFPMFCPQCGGAVDADARFCKHCAFDLTRTSHPGATVTTAASRQSKPFNPLALMVGVAIACLLALGLAGAYLYKRNHAQALQRWAMGLEGGARRSRL